MAEQNRKTPDQKLWRSRAKDTVDLYIEAIYAEVRNRDIAMESRHILATYSDHGTLPRGSGFSGFCNLGAKVDRMAHIGGTQDHHNAVEWLMQLPSDQRDALVYDRALRGRNRIVAVDPFRPDSPVTKLWTDDACAADLECSVDSLRRRISDGYAELERIMGFKRQEAA